MVLLSPLVPVLTKNALPALRYGIDALQLSPDHLAVSAVVRGGLVLEFARGNVGLNSGLSGLSPAGFGDLGWKANLFPNSLNGSQDGASSAINYDTAWTGGLDTVQRGSVLFLNYSRSLGNLFTNCANRDPNGPLPFYGPDWFPDFEGGFELFVTAGRSQSAFPDSSALLGVSASTLARLGWKRRN